MTVRVPAYVPEGLLLFSVVFGPLAFGAVEPWSRGILQTALFLLLITTASRGAGQTHPIQRTLLPALGGLILLGAVQLLDPRPASGPASLLPFTASARATAETLLLWSSYAALLWSAPIVLETPGARRRLAWVLLVLGAFVAVAGAIQAAGGNQFIYGFRPVRPGRDIFGPYYNRNHAASLMSMSFLAGFGLFISRFGTGRGGSRVTALSDLAATQAIVASLLGLLVYGLVGARSRGAILAGAVSLGIVGALAGLQLKDRRARWALHAGLLAAAAGFAGFLLKFPWWIGLQEYHAADAYKMISRQEIWRTSLLLFADFPVFGIGLGAFRNVFSAYQRPGILGFVEHAHNDWLELLLEAGGLGLAVLIAGLALLARGAASAWARERSREAWWISTGLIAAVLAFGLHGIVDFSFQIPGNAVVVLALFSALGASAIPGYDKAR